MDSSELLSDSCWSENNVKTTEELFVVFSRVLYWFGEESNTRVVSKS